MPSDGRTPRQKAAYHTLHNIRPWCRNMTDIGAQLDWTVKNITAPHMLRTHSQVMISREMASEYRELREVLRGCATTADFEAELNRRIAGEGGTA